MQWWSNKFHQGNKNHEDEEHSGWTSEAVNHQLRAITKAALIITQDIARELRTDSSTVVRHLKQTGKVWKSSINGRLAQEPTENQKELKNSLILCSNNELVLY